MSYRPGAADPQTWAKVGPYGKTADCEPDESALRRAFTATPKEIGRAAVYGAQRNRGPDLSRVYGSKRRGRWASIKWAARLLAAHDAALARVAYLEGELKNCQAMNSPLGDACVVKDARNAHLTAALKTSLALARKFTEEMSSIGMDDLDLLDKLEKEINAL